MGTEFNSRCVLEKRKREGGKDKGKRKGRKKMRKEII